MYQQSYDPAGNVLLSTLAAAIPILVLLYFIALHRHRDAQGNVHLGISAPYAAFFGVVAAFVVSCLVFRMTVSSAVSAISSGTLDSVICLDLVTLSAMAGRQLPFVSILVPFWLVSTFVKMEGGTWKEAFEVWPAALCAGLSFAVMQFMASGTSEFHLMTDVVSGVFSVICTALFLRFFWHPKSPLITYSAL